MIFFPSCKVGRKERMHVARTCLDGGEKEGVVKGERLEKKTKYTKNTRQTQIQYKKH
jgi:hypothetical protein